MPDVFFQKLGLLPDNGGEENDDTLNQIKYLYSKLRSKESKDKALEFIRFLKQSEKK